MDRSVCTAIVPYTPKRASASFVLTAFEQRKRLYAFSFIASICVFFAALCFSKRFGVYYGADLFAECDYLGFQMRTLLIAYIAGFTVFAPAVYVFSLFSYSFFCGCSFCTAATFADKLSVTVFLFFTVIYLCELCLCFEQTKYGIKRIFSPQRVLAFSLKTLLYVFISIRFFS